MTGQDLYLDHLTFLMIKVIAFDPGVTTGFAVGEIDESSGLMKVQTAQAKLDHKDLWSWLNNFKPDHIVCERFDFRQGARSGLELISRELIGIIELYCQSNDCKLKMQSPGQVIGDKCYWSDAKLKQTSIYRRGNIHANEAAKHLLYWAKFGPGFKFTKAFQLKDNTEAKAQVL